MSEEPSVVVIGDDDADGQLHERSSLRSEDAATAEHPLQILLITDFYHPYLGGVEQHVRSLGQALVAAGHGVSVVTLWRHDLAAEDFDGGVRIHRLRSSTQRLPMLFSSSERPWAPPIADPGISRQLRTIIAAEHPDIVHGHDWLSRSFLPLRRWSERRFGTRFVSSVHYYTLSCARKNLMQVQSRGTDLPEQPCTGPALGKCIACATRHFGAVVGSATVLGNVIGSASERRAASAFVAVSAAAASGNRLAVDERTASVIPNFLAPHAEGPPDATIAEYTAQLPDEPFILFVGDLRPMKGLDVLLTAYEGLHTSMKLVLIGKTWPDTPATFPAGVVVHDRWPNAAVLQAWRQSAIAVVPSVWAEPFGIVIIEAMDAGCAVVASRCGGIPEIIEHGVSGMLVPPGDAVALRAALAALVDDPVRRGELGAAAHRRARDFTAASVVPRIEYAYRVARLRPPRSLKTRA